MKTFRTPLLLCLLLIGTVFSAQAGSPPSHEIWNRLLQKHVTEAGAVNYKGFVADKAEFEKYLTLLKENHPEDSWSRDEQMVYWINAYNAFTVKLIVDNYPVKSIKDLGGKIYKVNTPWAKKFIELGSEVYSLDNIEHGILRKEWTEPRIHFAVNCASESCPRLRNEAFMVDKLNEQLDDQARYFVNNLSKNKITADKLEISKIFSWFKGDFTKDGTVIEFLNKYVSVKINEDAEISHLDYGWGLNE